MHIVYASPRLMEQLISFIRYISPALPPPLQKYDEIVFLSNVRVCYTDARQKKKTIKPITSIQILQVIDMHILYANDILMKQLILHLCEGRKAFGLVLGKDMLIPLPLPLSSFPPATPKMWSNVFFCPKSCEKNDLLIIFIIFSCRKVFFFFCTFFALKIALYDH